MSSYNHHNNKNLENLNMDIKSDIYTLMSDSDKINIINKVPEFITSIYEPRNKDVIVIIKKHNETLKESFKLKFGRCKIYTFNIKDSYNCRMKKNNKSNNSAINELRVDLLSQIDEIIKQFKDSHVGNGGRLLRLVLHFDRDDSDVYNTVNFYLTIRDIFSVVPHAIEIVKKDRPFHLFTKSKDERHSILSSVSKVTIPSLQQLGKTYVQSLSSSEICLETPLIKTVSGQLCRSTLLFQDCDMETKRIITNVDSPLKQICITIEPKKIKMQQSSNKSVPMKAKTGQKKSTKPTTKGPASLIGSLATLNNDIEEYIKRPERAVYMNNAWLRYGEEFVNIESNADTYQQKFLEFIHHWDPTWLLNKALNRGEEETQGNYMNVSHYTVVRLFCELYDKMGSFKDKVNANKKQVKYYKNGGHDAKDCAGLTDLTNSLNEVFKELNKNILKDLIHTSNTGLHSTKLNHSAKAAATGTSEYTNFGNVKTLSIFDNRSFRYNADVDDGCHNVECLNKGSHLSNSNSSSNTCYRDELEKTVESIKNLMHPISEN
ncbi:hypothetical protein WICPIJ_008838 [Wickerhamomyces pijperi]|uniref:Uncharacterized protein n=1 Tax=Wickerhamomyces pijperi TaxID=599730 RepID=A0A9P8TH84_WICPI|nr:hypothetical protein WICPIJ_008838 [Wickerhamomyces pijperi]